MNKERQSSRVTCFEHFYIKFVIHANRADWIQQRKCLNDNQHLNGSIEQTAIFEKKLLNQSNGELAGKVTRLCK
jgi:hypothetical protein